MTYEKTERRTFHSHDNTVVFSTARRWHPVRTWSVFLFPNTRLFLLELISSRPPSDVRVTDTERHAYDPSSVRRRRRSRWPSGNTVLLANAFRPTPTTIRRPSCLAARSRETRESVYDDMAYRRRVRAVPDC